MNLCTDTFLKIVEFLSVKDAINLCLTKKEYSSFIHSKYFWIVLGRRDYPVFHIENRKDYQEANPLLVLDEDLEKEMKTNKWVLSTLYKKRNERINHLVEAYVKSIIKNMLIVKKYRVLYDRYKNVMNVDWRMSINWMIDQYLKESEKEEKELEYYK